MLLLHKLHLNENYETTLQHDEMCKHTTAWTHVWGQRKFTHVKINLKRNLQSITLYFIIKFQALINDINYTTQSQW